MLTDLEKIKNIWNKKWRRFQTHTNFLFPVLDTIYNHMTTIQFEELNLCTKDITQRPAHLKLWPFRAVWSDGAMNHFAFSMVVKVYIDFHRRHLNTWVKINGDL